MDGGSVECDALVEVADRLRWSAPELTVQFAMRALKADAEQAVRTRAHSLLAPSLVTLGRHAEAVEPALVALRAATAGGQIERSARLRVAIAACARALGEPLTGCEILRPVLQTKTAKPATRAVALGQFVTCAAHVGGRDDLEDALAEAERLLASDDGLSQDARRVEGALLAVRSASYHRRHGDTEAAADTARAGLAMLTKLHDPISEGGRVRARLTLELVCALLDEGHLDEAVQAAEPVLSEAVRAAAAPAIGRLRLALATRVHIPAGRTDVGRTLLCDVVYTADRHGLDSLLADAWTFLAHADEQADHPTEALHALRSARAAEYRHMRAVDLARHRLSTEFGLEQRPERIVSQLRSIVRSGAPTRPQPVHLPEQAARRQSAEDKQPRTTRGGTFALTLVSVAPVGTAPAIEPPEPPVPVGGDVALNALASHVRDLAPDKAELLRTDLGEFAVLLPQTTHAEAEHLAATIRDRAIESAWLVDDQGRDLAIRTGVATQPAAGDSPRDGVDALLDAARDALSRPFAPRTEPSNPDVAEPADSEHPDFERPGSPRLASARADLDHPNPPPGRPETEFPDFGLPDLGLPDFALVDFPFGEFGSRPFADTPASSQDQTPEQVKPAATPSAAEPAVSSAATSEPAAPTPPDPAVPATAEEPQGVSALLEAARSGMQEQLSEAIAPDAPLPRRRRRAPDPEQEGTDTAPNRSAQATSGPATGLPENPAPWPVSADLVADAKAKPESAAESPAPSRRDRGAARSEKPVTAPVSDAQALLSRFGIEPRGGGGRRRAPDEDPYESMFDTDTATTPPMPEPDNVPTPPEGPNIPTPPERPPLPVEPKPAPSQTPTPDEVPSPEPDPDVEPPPSTADMLARLSALVAPAAEPSRVDAETAQSGALPRRRAAPTEPAASPAADGLAEEGLGRRGRARAEAESAASATAGSPVEDRPGRRSRARAEAEAAAATGHDGSAVDTGTAPPAPTLATRSAEGEREPATPDVSRRSRQQTPERSTAGEAVADVVRPPAEVRFPTAGEAAAGAERPPAAPDFPSADTGLADVESDEERAIAVSSEWLGFSALRGVGLSGGAQPGERAGTDLTPAESVVAPFPPADATASVIAPPSGDRAAETGPRGATTGPGAAPKTEPAAADHPAGPAVADASPTTPLTRRPDTSPAALPDTAPPAAAPTAPAGVAPEPVTPTGPPNTTEDAGRYTEASRSSGVFDVHDSGAPQSTAPAGRSESAASAVVASSRAARRAAADSATPSEDHSAIAHNTGALEPTASTAKPSRAQRRASAESAGLDPTSDQGDSSGSRAEPSVRLAREASAEPLDPAPEVSRRSDSPDSTEPAEAGSTEPVGRRSSEETSTRPDPAGSPAEQAPAPSEMVATAQSPSRASRRAADPPVVDAPSAPEPARETTAANAPAAVTQDPPAAQEPAAASEPAARESAARESARVTQELDAPRESAAREPARVAQEPAAPAKEPAVAKEPAPVDVIPGAARSAAAAAWARRTAGKTDEERARRLSAVDGGSQASAVRRTARRERSSSGLAELLAEAMVAYQETTQPPPTPSGTWAADARAVDDIPATPQEQPAGGRRRAPEDAPPPAAGNTRSNFRGRHRSSEWAPADIDSG
ncbi:hypothetical protein [Actinokineospora xionganensis]|uniref:GGDEF domain-containing protein n=1 Tax=Actinokineospora xionganensis TaxID=2684470 RepID=A0ABR7LBP4_9PSEU|nr:hypothetical protein [Actinokineospora xionganensis]MBC6449779.1 hypothetical protein [Actinokineospora xionganensis]